MAFQKRAALALFFLAVPGQAARTGEEDQESSELQPPNYAAGAMAASNNRQRAAGEKRRVEEQHEKNWAKYGQDIEQDIQTITSLPQQPPEGAWQLAECLGSGKNVQKKDYHYTEGSPKATPKGAFRFDKAQFSDLAFQACMPNPEAINDYCLPPNLPNARYDAMAEAMEPTKRGECCGGLAELYFVEEECGRNNVPPCSLKRVAKFRCVGFAEGEPCRLSSWLMGAVASNSCAEGYECQAAEGDSKAVLWGGPNTGVCVEKPQ